MKHFVFAAALFALGAGPAVAQGIEREEIRRVAVPGSDNRASPERQLD